MGEEEVEEVQLEPGTIEWEIHENAPFEVKAIDMPTSTGYFREAIHSSFAIDWDEEPIELWIGESLRDASGEWHDFPASPSIPKLEENGRTQYIPVANVPQEDSLLTGPKTHVLSLWDRPPDEEGAIRFMRAETKGELILFSNQETFDQWPNTRGWTAADHQIGLTRFDPDRIDRHVEEGLAIHMGAGGNVSGEIRTLDTVSYGSYEIAMTVPDNPGTLTGFFLYNAPDYFHEIDIEVMNNSTGEIWLTTYADGQEQHAYKEQHDFDPTGSMNIYRIDYFQDYTAFFLNGEELARYTDGYSQEPMQLMVNYWTPDWLSDTPLDEETSLHIHWINH